jgi:hypothetical protein
MRSRTKRMFAAVLIALVASVGVTGCGSSGVLRKLGGIFTPNHQNDMAQWQVRTEKEARAYEKSRYVVVELMPDGSDQRKRGVVTDLQYAEFNTYEQNVATAEVALKKDFDSWASTGTKPADFDGHAATVREWQNKLINLVKAVRP